MTVHRLLAWLPADQRKPLLQRLLIVWAVSLPIAIATGMGHPSEALPHHLDVALVYAYAISTLIWLLTDVPRFVFRRLLHSEAPSYWPPALHASLMLLVGIPLGYVLGTLVGDAYGGKSTWDLVHFNPSRFISLLVTGMAISAAFVAFFYQRGKAQSLAGQVAQAQLMLLQSQLEPHMLFNTLANLRALIATDPQRAQTMLDHLIAYLRATLGASRQTQHALQNEFDRVRDYLEIMAVRMGPRLVFSLDLPQALAATSVPTLLLQPLVENALLHGLEPKIEGGSIRVLARCSGGQLVLEVQDTGCGLRDNGASPSSFGLAQVRERLASHYGPQAALTLSSPQPPDKETGNVTGTLAQITLPLLTNGPT